jgi:hypothetical protein
VLDIVTGRTGFRLISKGRERMLVCVQRVRIKNRIRHPSTAIYALRPVLESHLTFATFQFTTYRIYGVTTKKVLKIIMIMEMVMFANGR